jgi:uncharacterized DUF497 family protein
MNGTALTHKTRFEWDRAKAKACYQKHKETFETAAIVFAIITQDRIEGGKCRWQTLGLVDSVGGPHDWRDRKRRRFIRIISACRADLKTSSDILNKPSTHYEIDLSNPPPSTPSQRAEIEALKAMPDRAIDYGGIPPCRTPFGKWPCASQPRHPPRCAWILMCCSGWNPRAKAARHGLTLSWEKPC